MEDPLLFVGTIRDAIHTTISFTSLEQSVMDHPYFQRLRRLHQTAFVRYAFPSATHTRFEHSLGVMHVMDLFYTKLVDQQNALLQQTGLCESLSATKHIVDELKKSPYVQQVLRLAALLHDIGHSPLCHSGECFMPTWEQFAKEWELSLAQHYPSWLNTCMIKKCAHIKNKKNTLRHEIYSLMAVAQLEKDGTLPFSYAQDVCAILDLDISPHPQTTCALPGLQPLLHSLMSGEVDADRMDYLIRDSKQSGVLYGYFDLSRLLSSLRFYAYKKEEDTHYSYHLACLQTGLAALEDYWRARVSMYEQVYFHKIPTVCEAMLKYVKKQSNYTFSLDIEAYMSIDDNNIVENISAVCNQQSKITIENLLLKRKLWKLLYEDRPLDESQLGTLAFAKELSSSLKVLLTKNYPDIRWEFIESTTHLTRLSPQATADFGHHLFRILYSDFQLNRRLDPIEWHSRLVQSSDQMCRVSRLFVDPQTISGLNLDVADLRKELGKKMEQETNT